MADIETFIKHHALFQDAPQIWQVIASSVRLRMCQKDEVLAHHGDNAKNLWLVKEGWIKLSRQTPDGKESITGLCTVGDIVGEAALYAHASYPATIEVLTHGTQLVCVPAEPLRAILLENPDLSMHVMALLGQRLNKTQLKLEHMNTLSAAQRLGCFLLTLCRGQGTHQDIQLPVEKHLIASYLGMKPETLSRAFGQLKEVDIHVNGTQVGIGDVEELRKFVCNSCSECGMCDTEEQAAATSRPITAVKHQ